MTEEERIEWLKGRQKYIGGSDIGAVAGDSPYQTKFDIYHSKVDEIIEDTANKQMRVGTDLEPVIGKWFAEEHDGWACDFNLPTEYGDEPYFGYNSDGILYPPHAAARPILYECKTAKFANDWGEAPYGKIPKTYYHQVQWGMGILGIEQAIVYVMIGGGFPIEYHVDADWRAFESLKDAGRDFWNRYVIPHKEPEVDHSKNLREELEDTYPSGKGIVPLEEIPGDINATLARWKIIEAELKEVGKRKDSIANQLRRIIKDRASITIEGKKLVTWNTTKDREVVDYPGVIASFARNDATDEQREILGKLMMEATQIKEGYRRLEVKV